MNLLGVAWFAMSCQPKRTRLSDDLEALSLLCLERAAPGTGEYVSSVFGCDAGDPTVPLSLSFREWISFVS